MERTRIVALSGPDNVGKSTQLRILDRRLGAAATNAGVLHDYDARWAEIRNGGLASWWFENSSIEDFVHVLVRSYLARLERARELTEPLVLVDRGLPMLEATIAATLATRLVIDDDDAADMTTKLLLPHRDDLDRAEAVETGIILLPATDPPAIAAASLARGPEANEVYRHYQAHLACQLIRLVAEGRFAHKIITGDRPIMAIQAEVRSVIADLWRVPFCRLPEVATIALGGMSESGKSTVGEMLHRRFGVARLKIGYLIEEAAARHAIADPYVLDEMTQAELVVDSLDRYTAGNRFVDRISIESLHRFEATRALKTLLGQSLTVAYVDTRDDLRRRRSETDLLDLAERDNAKMARGAKRIRSIADIVIDNNRTLLHLRRQVEAMVGPDMQSPRRMATNTLDLPAGLCDAVTTFVASLAGTPGVDLVAVTGSGGRGKYQHDWSDIDVLVLAETYALDGVQIAAVHLREAAAPVKVGLTVATAMEARVGALTPRLVHILRELGTGALAAQFVRSSLRLPVPSASADAETSLADGSLAAIEVRRQLLAGVPEVRALYKLAALLAKIMLRYCGRPAAEDRAALIALRAGESDLIDAARCDSVACARLATAVLADWLETMPATQ